MLLFCGSPHKGVTFIYPQAAERLSLRSKKLHEWRAGGRQADRIEDTTPVIFGLAFP